MSHRLLLAGLFAVFMWGCGGATSQTDTTGSQTSAGSLTDGERMIERGNFQGAATLFQSLIAESPNNAKAHYYLALSSSKLGNTDDAKTHYEKALELDASLMDAHINLGLLLMKMGELGGAEKELKIYLDASPDDADAHVNYGLVQESMEQFDSAKSHYEKAAELAPDDPAPLLELGDLARKQGDPLAALAYYEKARTLNGDMPEIVYIEGVTLIETEEVAKACTLFKTLFEMSTPNLAIISEAGKAIATSDKACAIALYEGAIETDENFAAAHFYLANLLARDKQFDKAATHFETFLKIAPEDPAAEDAKKRLAACQRAQ